MTLTEREFWTVIHGMVLGATFLLAFSGGLAGLWSLRSDPWYRANPPAGADLTQFPRSYLLANPHLAEWHKFGMEWKEHVAWLSPILATAVAYVVLRYGTKLAHDAKIRQALIVLFTIAFVAAGVAGLFGAFINKVAPIH